MSYDFFCYAERLERDAWHLLNHKLEGCKEGELEEFDDYIDKPTTELVEIFGGPDCGKYIGPELMRVSEDRGLPKDCSVPLRNLAQESYTAYPNWVLLGELKSYNWKHRDKFPPYLQRFFQRAIERLSTVGDDQSARLVYWFS